MLAADFNRDGALDLAVSGVADGLGLFQGRGDGSFAAPLLFRVNNQRAGALAAADFDGDGLPDLALLLVANNGTASLQLRYGAASGGFGAQATPALGVVITARALAVGDFNGDGKPDLALSGPSGRQLFLAFNSGNGTFAAQPPLAPDADVLGLAAGDFNRDGRADLSVATDRGTLFYLNDGRGALPATPLRLSFNNIGQTVLVGDFDQDGRADWLLGPGERSGGPLSLLLGDGQGGVRRAFNYGIPRVPVLPVSGDFNRDGKPDVALLQRAQESCALLLNDGTGALSAPTLYESFATLNAFALRDLNLDGKLDAVLATSSGLTLLPGDGQGGFGTSQTFNNLSFDGVALVFADFNRDGRQDIAALLRNDFGQPTRVALLLRTGAASFAAPRVFQGAPTATGAVELVTADFNGDGNPDLAVAHPLSNDVALLAGDGRGNLAAAVTFPVGLEPRSLALADFNADGLPDLAVANRNSATLALLRGDGRGGFETTFVGIGANPRQVLAADFNRDGKADLAVAHNNAAFIAVLLGNGDGTFRAPLNTYVERLPAAFNVADFNGDGRLDLAVTPIVPDNTPQPVRVFSGNGGGAFSLTHELPAFGAGGVETGDFNGDGLPELAVLGRGQLWLFANSCNAATARGQLANLSAASFQGAVLAPESIVAAFGTELSAQTVSASRQPLPLELGGASLTVKDSRGVEFSAPLLFVSPTQINYVLPRALAPGPATVTATHANGALSREQLQLLPAVPALFTANGDGRSAPAAFALRLRRADQTQTLEPLAQFDPLQNRFVPRAVRPPDIDGFVDELYLVLFGTGWRYGTGLAVRVGTTECEIVYAGPQGTLAGLDQINLRLRLPPGNNIGEFPLVVTADGKAANPVKVLFQYQ